MPFKGEGNTKRALRGVKVADFSWVMAGPIATKCLADHGAEVIKIESSTRVDSLRTMAPFKDGVPGLERSGIFATVNSSKYNLALDLNHPRSSEVTRRLIEWADIVVENFTPGTMERWGLDYESLVKIKPDIIMVSSSMHGQTGPLAKYPGLGSLQVSASGITNLTGWPDRAPVQPYGVYPDHIVPPLLVSAILAALDYRRRTGKGQHLDLSQNEATVYFIAPVMLDYAVNGTIQKRNGNRYPHAAPHGAYPCRGDDRWCVIAVFTDEEWEAFCKVIGNPEWTRDPKFTNLEARKKNEDELDELVAQWTIKFTPEEITALMQEAGVAAGIVETAEDLHNDPQLKHRHHYHRLNHPEIGWHDYPSPPFKLSKTIAELRAASCLGQDTEYVCTKLLGITDEHFIDLLQAGVLK